MSRLTRDGTVKPVLRVKIVRRERGQREMLILPVQPTTCRTGPPLGISYLTRLINTLAICVTIHNTYISLVPPWEYQFEWHRITRMTGSDCAVMFNLINIHTYIHAYMHTYIHTYIHTRLIRGLRNKYH